MWSLRTTQIARLATAGLAVVLGATVLPIPAGAAPSTVRVSTSRAGVPGNGPSDGAAVSASGRYVTFSSSASNLVRGDTNGYTDIFLRDQVTGTIERVNVSSSGAQANGGSYPVARISPDGRYVTFASTATNLDAVADSGDVIHVYLRDRATRTTRRVSVSSNEVPGNGHSFGAAVSANGRYVAFGSYASNLAAGDNQERSDIFIRDVRYGTTRLVSVAQDGTPSDGSSSFPVISNNGRYVGFLSDATNLQATNTSGISSAYVKDLSTGAVELASVSATGEAQGTSDMSMSADGRLVAYASHQPIRSQVYVRDRSRGTTVVASVDVDGNPSDGPSSHVSISADGRYVAFLNADVLVPGSAAGSIFVRDLRTATTAVGGVTSGGTYIDGAQWEPAVSNTGVAFNTLAPDVAPGGDDRHPYQVYYRQF